MNVEKMTKTLKKFYQKAAGIQELAMTDAKRILQGLCTLCLKFFSLLLCYFPKTVLELGKTFFIYYSVSANLGKIF